MRERVGDGGRKHCTMESTYVHLLLPNPVVFGLVKIQLITHTG